MSLNRPPIVRWIDHSGVITTANSPQRLMPVNTNRIGVLIENLHATEPMWVRPQSLSGYDAESYVPGSVQIEPNSRLFISEYADNGIWSIVAATADHPFTAYEWGE